MNGRKLFQRKKSKCPKKKKTMKNCSTFLAIKEKQIKTILRFYLTAVRMAIIKNTNNVGKDVGKMEPLYIAGRHVN
jgi:hypothetical protein